ncbi:retrovirus-related pol polyprotein from transposon TNT 1-94 [Tanacetum coccineum]|uniref:Retrovirus-related pol polyprotein from transposon TNT 1-94 n=1 Tax=Tanacetum coccineum TaxID=301880 RepID=A0ABQ4XNH3_9ASTR
MLIDAEAEAIHMTLNEIGNDIYSIVDAFPDAREMWLAIKRLQQGESINKQDVKAKLFWEFSKFTLRDKESIESYYTRFYRMMNEMVRNKLKFDTMQQHQNKVNEIRDERIARNVNLLALVAATQHYPGDYTQSPKPYKIHTHSSRQTPSTRTHATTRNKGKEIVKPPSPQSESASEEDIDEEQTQRDKKMQKSLALTSKHFKNIYRPTNNNLITSSNTRNKNVDTSSRTGNDRQTGHFGNQRTVTVAGNRETVGNQVVQQSRIQCISLSAERNEWLQDNDEEPNEQKLEALEAHYMYMAKIQEVLHVVDDNSGPTYDAEPLEKVHTDDYYNVFANEKQHSKQPESINNTYMVEKTDRNVIPDSSDMCDNEGKADSKVNEPEDERVFLSSLIANLKLDVDENKNKQKQLKKANKSLTQELKKKKTRSFFYCKLPQESSMGKPCLNNVQYDKNDLANIFAPESEETIHLAEESRSKLGLLLTRNHSTKWDPIYPTLHHLLNVLQIVQIILFIVDFGCTKHMTGNHKLLCNFVEKYLGTVRFGNDQFAPILGYGDMLQGNVTIKRIYYIKGLNHNLFSVGQFYDANLEVVLRKSTCFVRDIQGNDLLMGTRGSDLYTIALQESSSPTSICFMEKASPIQAWLRHCRLSHLNFDTINLLSKNDIMNGLPKLKYVKYQLYSSCEMGKAKKATSRQKLLQVQNEGYICFIWTYVVRCGLKASRTPVVLIDFSKMIHAGLLTHVY